MHVTILGKGGGGNQADHQRLLEDGEERWGINDWLMDDHGGWLPHSCTRWFQMHPPDVLIGKEKAWLQACDVPIYILRGGSTPILPGPVMSRHATVYPFGTVQAAVAAEGSPFASSFDYAMALALTLRADRIRVVGAHFQAGSPRERLLEHVSFAYWVGLAKGSGVEVTLDRCYALDFPHRYGYDFEEERTWGQRMAFWSLLNMLSFRWDDGQAVGGRLAEGWRFDVGSDRVSVEI